MVPDKNLNKNKEIKKSYKEVGPKYLGESGNSDGIRDLRFIRLVQVIMGEFLIISKFG